ncbi:MAG: hypothetical protein FWG66_01050, partial [Spirochaetes bacterium]|nr:hypothetical protein [Spirochaetota bacterium]
LRTVNNVLVSSGSPLRLAADLPMPRGRSAPLGFWYSMAGTADTMFVFAFFQDGALIPSAAILSPAGEVREIIPLSLHAGAVFSNIPPSVIQMYSRRIEAAFRSERTWRLGQAAGGGALAVNQNF